MIVTLARDLPRTVVRPHVERHRASGSASAKAAAVQSQSARRPNVRSLPGSFGAKTDFNTSVGPSSLVIGDFNADGKPDLAATTSNSPATVSILVQLVRDHRTDANGDGYSAADEITTANCGATNCATISTFGTAETPTCKDSGSNCGTPGASTDDSVPVRVAPLPATGYGCSKTLDVVGPKTTVYLAKSDVDLDGAMSILDLSIVAGWFNNTPNPSATDPRWEGDVDGDGVISILDLSTMADNFNRNVLNNCKVE